jgi:hypothetical protein
MVNNVRGDNVRVRAYRPTSTLMTKLRVEGMHTFIILLVQLLLSWWMVYDKFGVTGSAIRHQVMPH